MNCFTNRLFIQLHLVVFLLLVLAPGCAKKSPTAAAAAPPPLEVAFMTVKTEAVTLFRELPGRTSAYRIAEVRARVDGIVQERLFTEGAEVAKGQVLFQIDPTPYQVELENAKAMLARAEAQFEAVRSQADRYESLVATNAISRQTYEDAKSSELALKADIAAGEAMVNKAEINLDYTKVVSPISGRIGRAEVTEGAYVRQSTANLLATVQQLDPLYVDLSQSAEEVIHLKEALSSGRLQRAGEGELTITVLLGGGQTYPHDGSLNFSDVTVNPTTGTVTLRGTIPNPELDLLPGMFVRARLLEGTDPQAILIPQAIVSRNPKGEPTVFMVDSENKVEIRAFQTSRTVGDRWLVSGGLVSGDHLIMDNRQKIRAGQPVRPVPFEGSETPGAL